MCPPLCLKKCLSPGKKLYHQHLFPDHHSADKHTSHFPSKIPAGVESLRKYGPQAYHIYLLLEKKKKENDVYYLRS